MPIDDAGQRWDEAKSPFLKVATLHLSIQKFRNDKRTQQAEVPSFSPAHSMPAHAPLGGLNRARRKIYAGSPGSGTSVTSAPDRPETALRSAYDV